MFLSLVNRRLIELTPDIISQPHIHLDASLVILYYAILYIGSALNASIGSIEQQSGHPRLCYLACLRALNAWERDATGCTTDLIAALLMVRFCLKSDIP